MWEPPGEVSWGKKSWIHLTSLFHQWEKRKIWEGQGTHLKFTKIRRQSNGKWCQGEQLSFKMLKRTKHSVFLRVEMIFVTILDCPCQKTNHPEHLSLQRCTGDCTLMVCAERSGWGDASLRLMAPFVVWHRITGSSAFIFTIFISRLVLVTNFYYMIIYIHFRWITFVFKYIFCTLKADFIGLRLIFLSLNVIPLLSRDSTGKFYFLAGFK